MNRTAAILSATVMAAALACVTRNFTIIPTAATSWKLMDEIRPRREDVVLVIPPAWAATTPAEVVGSYGVKRQFVIGPSLEAITRAFFEHTFARIVASETRPTDAGTAAFIVEPELSGFAASQSWTGKYTFEVALRARVTLPGDEQPLGTFEGVGKQEAVSVNEATFGNATNWVLQLGVADLVGKLARELPARSVTAPAR